MSIGRKDSPSRRRLLIEGRTKVALMAAAAVAGTAAGAGVPALAGTSTVDPACDDPGRTTATIVVEGRVIDCAAEPPATAASVTAATTADPPAATTTTEQATTVPPAPAASGETTTAAPDPDPPAVPQAEPQPPAAGDADPAPSSPAPAAPAAQTPGHPAAAPAPTANAGRPLPPRRVTHRVPTHRTAAHTPAHRRPAHPATPDGRRGTAHDSAAVYAALPSAWTSIRPIVLPAGGVAGFPIPPFLLPIYQAAAAQYGVPWEILAAVNEIETDFGRDTSVSSAGALGWMQFIRSSWARWGTDGDGDHRRDPRNPVDAIFAAARYLHDAGAARDLPRAVFAYNHAGWYVDRVVRRAREFAGLDPQLVSALTAQALEEHTRLYHARGNPYAGDGAVDPSAGAALLLSKRLLTRIVLHSDDIHVYDGGRQDIAAGRVTRRVLATLVFLARSGLKPTVSCLQTGHSLLTTSGNVSAHSYGHAVDISAINGIPILGHQGAGSITATTLGKLVELQGYLQPNQIITLMTVAGHDNTLAMSDHDDHIHVGFPRLAQVHGARGAADRRRILTAFPGR